MRFAFTALFIFFKLFCCAQTKPFHLEISGLPKTISKDYAHQFPDSASASAELKKQINYLQFLGYFTADVSSIKWKKDTLSVFVEPGNLSEGIFLTNGNLSKQILSQSFIKDLIQKHKPISLVELEKFYQSTLKYYENNGYPFASIWLDSLDLKEDKLRAQIFSNPNQKITIDTLRLIGEAKLSQAFLSSYLGIKVGDNYQELKAKQIDEKLKALPFVTVPKSTEIVFTGEKAKINLFLNKQNANQFDGILGFLPNANNGKLQLTGDFKLSLKNALKNGETFDFNYRGLPSQSQELTTHLNYPYLFKTSLGIDFNFQLFKRDTSFLNLNSKLAFDYFFDNNKKISFFFEKFSGNQVGNTAQSVKTLPPFANIKTTFYGLSTTLLKLDDRITPLQGYDLFFDGGVGNRKISASENFNPADFYSSKSQIQYKLSSNLKYYLKLSSRSVFFLHNFASTLTGNQLFQNEGFRIGGAKTLRGFDEQSILASSFSIQTFEFRYLLEKNSYLQAFYDQAFIDQNFIDQTRKDHPLGFGLGITFQTKVGIASLSYALGKQKNIPVNLQKGKIHFGILSYF
jgi:hemolysin activation/secretion protein